MAYSTNNRPFLIVPAVAGGFGATFVTGVTGSSDCGGNVWAYRSTDAASVVAGANYFTDGFKMGLRRGDILVAQTFSTALAYLGMALGAISSVGASSAANWSLTASSS
jgi:hypothetical protein